MKKKSALDKEQKGTYRVQYTTVNNASRTYTDHTALVDSADSPRDAMNKATAGYELKGAALVSISALFLGATTGLPVISMVYMLIVWTAWCIVRWVIRALR